MLTLRKRKRLCILILSSHFYPRVDGTTKSIDKIIKNLTKKGHRILFVTRIFPKTSGFEVYEQAEIYRTGPSGFSIFSRLLLSVNQAKLAMKIIKRNEVDVLQAHGFAPMFACFILKTIFRKPVVLFFHGLPRMWISEFKWRKPYEQLLSFPFEKFLIRRADRVVVRSNLFSKILMNIYGKGFENRIVVLPHPVNTKIFSFHMPSSTKPIILFVGSLAKVYGVDLLLRAAPLILQELPQSKFIIVGEGPLRTYLEKLVDELGIGRNVQFAGRIDDPVALAEYYQMSTLVVIPLYYKGYILSLVAVEALACGRPVVTTMTLEPGLENVGVFTVKTHDPRDLAQTILHVINDADLEALALSARNYVEKYHSEENYSSKLGSIYFELIDKAEDTDIE